jgi:glycosyltransferase involved in cell wall biosynthesis
MKAVRVAFFPMHPPDDRATGTFCVIPAERSAALGVTGSVFTPSSTGLRDSFYRRKTAGWRLRAAAYWYGLVLPRRIGQLLRARDYDVIFVQRSMFRWASPPLLEWLAGRLTDAPIAYHLDDGIWLAARRRWSEERCRLAATVVTGNQPIAEFAEAAGTPVTRIEYAVDASAYPVKEHGDRDRVAIGYTGIAPQEHLEPIAEALRAVCERTGARVLIVGGLQRPHLPGLDPHMDWSPWNPADEHSWAGDFDIGIMPLADSEIHRTKEPLKVKEYMAAGLPVVLSPVGHNLRVVTDGREGLFADGAEQWIAQLERLVADSDLRAEIGANGRRLVLERYDLPRMLEQLAALFHRLAREA